MPHNLPPSFGSGNQPFLPSGHIRKKQGLFSWLFKLLVSPASAFVFAFLGYYALAGLTNAFLPEGSLGGILIRGGTLGILVMAILRFGRRIPSKARLALYPISIFFFVYSLRIIENVYFSGIYIAPGIQTIILVFVLGGIFTSFGLSRIAYNIRDDQFMIIASALSFIFIIGMALNIDALLNTSTHRMNLEKMNPISMAHLAFSFLVYYILVFSKSKRLTIEAVIIVPILLLILVYARTRGAYLAGGASIIIYILLLKGSKRLWMILGLVIAVLVLLATTGGEYLEVIFKSLNRLTADDDMSAQLHVLAWYGAWQQFMDDFAFGRYAIELQTAYYPHNIYLESLMSVGLLGSIPFVFHFALATRAAVGIIRSRQFSIMATFIAILFFRDAIAAAGAGSIWGASGLWICSILVITFWYGRNGNIYTSQISPTIIR